MSLSQGPQNHIGDPEFMFGFQEDGVKIERADCRRRSTQGSGSDVPPTPPHPPTHPPRERQQHTTLGR